MRDYAGNSSQKHKKKKGRVIILGALIIAIFGGIFFIHHKKPTHHFTNTVKKAPKSVKSINTAKKANTNAPKPIKYEFYQLLPKMSVHTQK